MLDASKGGIKIYTLPSKAVHNACVTISVAANGNQWVLNSIRCGAALQSIANLHETAAIHAMIAGMEYKVGGRMEYRVKNRVASMSCAVDGTYATLSVICSPGKSVAGRVLKAAISGLNPSKGYAEYSVAVRRLGETPNRAYFDYVADALMRSAKNPIVSVTGKCALDNKSLAVMVEKAAGALKLDPVSGTKTKPAVHKAVVAHACAMPKHHFGDTIAAFLGRYYVLQTLRSPGHVVDGCLYIDSTSTKIAAVISSDRGDKFAAFVAKVADKDSGVFAYQAAVSCGVSAAGVSKASSRLTEAAIKAAIKAV